jgi:hypothetical protein
LLVHKVQKRQFNGIPFTFISSVYNYYRPLDVLSVVNCVEILYYDYMLCFYGCLCVCFIFIFPKIRGAWSSDSIGGPGWLGRSDDLATEYTT